MLKVTGLNASYGRSHVVQDIDFEVRAGEIVTLMGRNGAGKTTTLRSLMGLIKARSGSMVFNGHECLMAAAHTRFHLGLAYVPEVKIGDYVIVHVGFALSKVDEEEAQQVFEYLKRMDELGELKAGSP